MKIFFIGLFLVCGLGVDFYDAILAETPQCTNLLDKKYAASLAVIEMQRHILHSFEVLSHPEGSIFPASTLLVHFSLDDSGQPVNIKITNSSTSQSLEQIALNAVKSAAPFRKSVGCFEIQLVYKPPIVEPEHPGPAGKFYADPAIQNQYMMLGAGSDTYEYANAQEGQDIIDDESGKADRLLFGKKNIETARFQAQDGDDVDHNIDFLLIDFGKGNSITIFNYFNNTTQSIHASEPGPGLIEIIRFADKKPLSFDDIKKHLKEGDVGKVTTYPTSSIASVRSRRVSFPRPNIPKTGNDISAAVASKAAVDAEQLAQWRNALFCKIYSRGISSQYEGNHGLLVTLKIEGDGSLAKVITEKSSGDKTLDSSAIANIKAAAPFAAPPSRKSVTISFQYSAAILNRCPIPNPPSSYSNARNFSTDKPASTEMIDEPYFGPYKAELERRIRRSWSPPVDDRSKRVAVMFHIGRDGRLLDSKVQQSSGSLLADQAALAAVQAAAPFRTLPALFRGNDIPVMFIFDYEIAGHGNARLNSNTALPPNPIAPTIYSPTLGIGPHARVTSTSSRSANSSTENYGPSMISGNPTRQIQRSSDFSNPNNSPGGGDGRAGIDAQEEPDFAPYIADLHRRIRRNWAPPLTEMYKHVEVNFHIARDGRLISVQIQKSSGSPVIDQAAINAVRASAPFHSLPPTFRGKDLEGQFIGDYGGGDSRRR